MTHRIGRRIGAALARAATAAAAPALGLAIGGVAAQAQEPWATPEGRACIDAWTDHVGATLNAHDGDDEFDARKPWSVNRYGLFGGDGIWSAFEPDNWTQFGADRAQWMWGNYTTEAQFPDWNNPNFNAAGLQGLRWFVRDCLADGGGVTGGVPGGQGPGSQGPGTVVLDASAACPDNFSMHTGSTLMLICWCGPDAFQGRVWGTGTYTADSALCQAAMHAGAVGPGGGTVTVQGAPGLTVYQGTAAFGVTSMNFGAYGWSFTFPGIVAQTSSVPGAPACPGDMLDLRGTNTPRTCHCAPDALVGGVWGTDVYTDDSTICAAALHAGFVGPDGGVVTAVPAPGQASYRGSDRNGIASQDYGSWDGSYVFQ
ncbi:MAG: LCCL domain-containing protein [Alphaproteobacteria bacterium]